MNDSRKIDHETIETHFREDTNADPEGSEIRDSQNKRTSREVPLWVADEFNFVFTARLPAGMSDDEIHKEKLKDSNWRFQAHKHVVAAVEEACQPVYNRRLRDIETTEEGKTMVNEYYKHLKGLITFASEGEGGDQWCAYGISLAIISQGCKEVASSVRFAQRAEQWQTRLNADENIEELGPTNMLEKAVSQAMRGVAICEAITKAYNSTVTGLNAARLRLNFKTATYTTLGIEASTKRKQYDHPGVKMKQQKASAGAANALFGDFHNK